MITFQNGKFEKPSNYCYSLTSISVYKTISMILLWILRILTFMIFKELSNKSSGKRKKNSNKILKYKINLSMPSQKIKKIYQIHFEMFLFLLTILTPPQMKTAQRRNLLIVPNLANKYLKLGRNMKRFTG